MVGRAVGEWPISNPGEMMSQHPQPPASRRVGCLSRTVYIVLLVALVLAFAGGSIYLLWFYPWS